MLKLLNHLVMVQSMDRNPEEKKNSGESAKGSEALMDLMEIVKKLRGPGGCPWDRQQTPQSLRPYLLEEAYEVADAAEKENWDVLKKELGDLLLHIILMCRIAEEKEKFSLQDVAAGITKKLIRRHPHVFKKEKDLRPHQVEQQWEAIKAEEKKEEGFFSSLPDEFPALQAAWRIQQRAASVGFDWPDIKGALEKMYEEMGEFQQALNSGDKENREIEAGDVLFSIVNIARIADMEPELLLRQANRKFVKRFERMRELLIETGISLGGADLQQMEEAWQKAKSD